jgi:hypothetical protein
MVKFIIEGNYFRILRFKYVGREDTSYALVRSETSNYATKTWAFPAPV